MAHDAGFDEYRAYSWKEDYAKVKDRMAKELAHKGFQAQDDRWHFVSWARKDGWAVQIIPGRSNTRLEALTGKTSDSNGVTVFVQNPAPENWMTHLRYGIEPSDY